MSDNSCNKHRFQLWNGNSRVCVKCGYVETLPMTDSIQLENSKQKEAKMILQQFLALNDNSVEAIQGIRLILNHYLFYLDANDLTLFQNKAKEVAIANNLSELSISCILLYVDKIKKYEDISDTVHSAFNQFMDIFDEEVYTLVSSNEKKATL